MSNKKQEYVIDWEAYKEGVKEKHGIDTDIYEAAKELNVTYQTVTNITEKPVRQVKYLVVMARLCGLSIDKLIKKK